MAQALTVIAKIKSGEEDALAQILEAINHDLGDNAYIRFPQSQVTHIARLAILNDPENGFRLLFSSNYDGDLESYLQEIVQISPGIDAVWGKCEGYEGSERFSQFIHQHFYQPAAFFVAFQKETLKSLRNYIAIRQQLEQFLNLKDVAQFLNCSGIKPFLDRVSQIPSSSRGWKALGGLVSDIFAGIDTLIQSLKDLIRQVLVSLLMGLSKILGKPDNPQASEKYISLKPDLKQSQILAATEDRFVQNPMTHLADIKPGRLLRLRIVLFLTHFAGKYLFPPGSLLNITTIHFARWLIIDGGKRLLFLSNFDDSWENYLGDFVNRASDGLNSIWNNTVAYPEGGAQDLEGFKVYFRDYQTPTQVYYSAYPDETVTNSLRDQQISKILQENFDRAGTEEWLKLL